MKEKIKTFLNKFLKKKDKSITLEKRYIVEKEFEHCGLRCVCVLQNMGHRCGYVGVDESHPLYGEDYDHEAVSNLDVHGGVTYSNGDGYYPIESDLWWFGFDCAHYMDLNDNEAYLRHFPHLREMIETRMQIDKKLKFDHGVVRTLEYVENQCKKLAEQLSLNKEI